MEADGVLTVLAWLGRTFESFTLRGGGPASRSVLTVTPPPLDDGRRFDPRLIQAALSGQRIERGLSWTAVAAEIGGTSAAGLTRLQRDGRLAVPGVVHLAEWLGRPPESLTAPADW